MRTPLDGSSAFSGSVSLSKNGQRPRATPMSTTSPNRKPRRMPCFTQTLTRQPVGDAESGSADRTRPADRPSRSSRNAPRAASRDAALPCSKSSEMVDWRLIEEMQNSKCTIHNEHSELAIQIEHSRLQDLNIQPRRVR